MPETKIKEKELHLVPNILSERSTSEKSTFCSCVRIKILRFKGIVEVLGLDLSSFIMRMASNLGPRREQSLALLLAPEVNQALTVAQLNSQAGRSNGNSPKWLWFKSRLDLMASIESNSGKEKTFRQQQKGI